MSERVWEFTFMAVQSAETYEQALAAVQEYLAEQAGKCELEPTAFRVLGDDRHRERDMNPEPTHSVQLADSDIALLRTAIDFTLEHCEELTTEERHNLDYLSQHLERNGGE